MQPSLPSPSVPERRPRLVSRSVKSVDTAVPLASIVNWLSDGIETDSDPPAVRTRLNPDNRPRTRIEPPEVDAFTVALSAPSI